MTNEQNTQEQVVVLDKLCRRHTPRQTFTVQVRHDRDRTEDILVCGDCWRRDPQTLDSLCRAIGLSESDIELVKTHALSK